MVEQQGVNNNLMEDMHRIAGELDKLIDDSNTKAAQLETKQIVVKNKPCGHHPTMNRLREEIGAADDMMNKLEGQIDEYVNGEKERQMAQLKRDSIKEQKLLAKI